MRDCEAFGEAARRMRTLPRPVCATRGARAAAEDDRDSSRDPRRSLERKSRLTMTERPEKMAVRPTEPDPEASGLVWVKGSDPAVAPGLEAALKAAGYEVYCGQEAPGKDVRSSIICWPNREEDVGSEVRRLRVLSQDAPILALHVCVDPQLVLTALRAGARRFVGMRPSRIIRALSTASRGGIVVARELLEAFLVERASREDRLAPRQREILFEVATVVASSGGEPVFPRKLLEAFLVEVMMA